MLGGVRSAAGPEITTQKCLTETFVCMMQVKFSEARELKLHIRSQMRWRQVWKTRVAGRKRLA